MAEDSKNGRFLLKNSREQGFFNDNLLINKLALILKKSFPVNSFKRLDTYHDEPRIFQYAARSLKNNRMISGGIGTSFSENKAKLKALGEFFERTSLANTHIGKNKIAINKLPKANLSELCELASGEKINILNNKNIAWVAGYDLKTHRKIKIPSQLIFVPYKFKRDEPVIRPPISTGAAAGIGYSDAILRAILEVIERDAFVISYHTKTINSKIDVSHNKFLTKILAEIKRCQLELQLLDISSDTGPYVFLSLILDKTSSGPPLSAGLKAGFNPREVALGSIEESLHSRTWIRDIMLGDLRSKKQKVKIKTILDRALYWLDPKLIKSLDFYLKAKKIKKLSSFPNKNMTLKKLLDELFKRDMNVVAVDLTQNDSWPLKIVKVIIPELQPLYLDENYAILGNRVKNKNNNLPHFFL